MMRAAVVMLAILLTASGCAPRAAEGPFGASPERASDINAELGAGYLQSGELQQAKDRLERALEQNPDNVNAHVTYAILQTRLDNPDGARTHFERAMRLEADNPRLHNNYGIFLCEQGEYDEGIDLITRAARNRLYDRPARAWSNAGTCARDAGHIEDARQYLQQAVDTDPRAGGAWLSLAELEYDTGNMRGATRALDAFHDLTDPTARSLWVAVRIERATGNREAADRHGRSLLRDFPDSDEAERFLETR